MPPFLSFLTLTASGNSLAASSKYTQNQLLAISLAPCLVQAAAIPTLDCMMASPGSLCLSLFASYTLQSISQSDPGKHVGSSLSSAQNFPGHPFSPIKASHSLWPMLALPSLRSPRTPLPCSSHASHGWPSCCPWTTPAGSDLYAFTPALPTKATQLIPSAFQVFTEPSPLP